MGLISRVSSRTYRSFLQPKKLSKKHPNPQKMAVAHQFCTGHNKGHKVNKLAGHKNDQSRKRGGVTNKTSHVRKVIREVVGYAGYEKRCIELLKISKDKRALKFCKKRLGTHTAAKRKREEMQSHIQEEKRAKKAH